MNHKVSIVTSIFKGNDYITPFLVDITRQTTFDQCQLLLINANSPHDEEETCLEYVDKYPDNISYLRLDEDPGVYAVWNIGVGLAETPYLTNANLDDRLHPECLEKHIALLDADPLVDLAYCYNLCTFKPNETWEKHTATRRYPTAPFIPSKMIRMNLPHNHPVWRVSLHDRFGGFDEQYGSAGDWEFWLRCVKGGAQFKLIPENLGLYYFNPTGISTCVENTSWKLEEEARIRQMYQNESIYRMG